MGFSSLPVEIVLLIAKRLDIQDLAATALVTRGLHQSLMPLLHTLGARPGMQTLSWAAKRGRIDLAKAMIRCSCNLDEPDGQSRTALHYAASKGSHLLVTLLIENNCFVDPQDNRGNTPLHLAVKKGFIEVVKVLVKTECRHKLINRGGQSPIRVSAKGTIDPVDNDGRSPLHLSAISGSLPIAKLLLESGCRVDQYDDEGLTPLHLVLHQGHNHLLSYLLLYGACPDRSDRNQCTPLHTAARYGNIEATKALLAGGCNIDTCDRYGYTALHYAIRWRHPELSILLLVLGANVKILDNEGCNPLHFSVLWNLESVLDMILDMYSQLDIDIAGPEGWTALHLAARLGYTSMIIKLLNKGFPIDPVNEEGITPLGLAVGYIQYDAARTLLAYGAHAGHLDLGGDTLVDIARYGGSRAIMALLMAYNLPTYDSNVVPK